MTTTGPSPRGTRTLAPALFCAVVTIVCYLPTLQNDFVNWDDNLYVYENPSIRHLDLNLIRSAFFGFHASGNWHPLTLLSHALDYAVWGLNPMGHHLTSVLLHGANTFLVVIVVMRLIEARRRRGGGLDEQGGLIAAVVTGLLFGIHPLHVESVAWISERKDVLYAMFYLLGILAYLRYAEERKEGKPWWRDRRYALVVVLYVLSLMSKPMAVTFPAVLLLLDWYPLGRLRPGSVRDAVADKVPLFFLSAAASVLALLAQAASEAVASLEVIPLSSRVPVALRSFMMYICKMAAPAQLLPLYTHPLRASLFSLEYLVPAVLAVLLAAVCILLARRIRLLPAALAFYAISISPVLGIIQVGGQAMADRYTYLPGVGLFLLAGAGIGVNRAAKSGAALRRRAVLALVVLGSVVFFTSMALVTERQIAVWKNALTLWDHEIRNDPVNHEAYNSRGYYFFARSLYVQALRDYNRAIQLSPAPRADYLNNRAHVYMALGSYEDALSEMTEAIAVSGGSVYRYFNDRAIVHVRLGRYQDALSDYDAALRLRPDFADAYYNRGNALVYLGRPADAVKDYSRAIQVSRIPNPDYYHNRAVAYEGTGRLREAADDYQQALELMNADRHRR